MVILWNQAAVKIQKELAQQDLTILLRGRTWLMRYTAFFPFNSQDAFSFPFR